MNYSVFICLALLVLASDVACLAMVEIPGIGFAQV
jgi:hypothetical protein